MYKETKWAEKIISLQDEEGKWGDFHSLSAHSEVPITTEQALRRLEILGYSMEDDCIQKAVSYMNDCLTGKKQIPDRREKLHDWNIFTSMILAAWIRRFTKEYASANAVAEKWAKIITTAFQNGQYDHKAYGNAYYEIMGIKPKGGRMVDFTQFYVVSLISDLLDDRTEIRVVNYILDKPDGIYYVYDRCLRELPAEFAGKQLSRYLGAMELLAEYPQGRGELAFVVNWLMKHQRDNGTWDMGSAAKGLPYFPLSDNWRNRKAREADCTRRIENLITKIIR